MRINHSFEIPARAQSCMIHGDRFVPGMDYFSELKEDSEGKWLRRDYCAACWQEKGQKSDSGIFWKSCVPAQEAKIVEDPQIDVRMIKTLKELLISRQEEDKAFMIALFLARKRKIALRYEAADEANKRFQFYEVLETEEMIQVPWVPFSRIHTDEINRYFVDKFKK